MMGAFDPGRYLHYDEMTARLHEWASAWPQLCDLKEIGRSAEGRAIWAVILTNQATGPDRQKPGYLLDANTHAGEITGGAVAMYTIHWLLTNWEKEPAATELLNTRTLYVVPRIAVDGVERYLDTPHYLRSSPKHYPDAHAEEQPGFYPEDVNGDGLILQMRMVHPEGDWKADEQEPRLLVRRRPEDRQGPFYKLFPEGLMRGWDGKGILPVRSPWNLDFNRNYPAFWSPEHKQPGAGPYPLSEPETRALAAFLVDHPNVGAYVSLHTTGCVLLRPPSSGGDEQMDKADQKSFQRVGELCTRMTGYTCKSTYQAFAYPGQEALVKGADDWAYEHLGVQAFTMELWSIDSRSGARGYGEIGVQGLLALSDAERLEDERKRLAYSDSALGGRGFIPWQPFTHPQLGPVEIGGWELKRCLQNPPEGPLLVDEMTKVVPFLLQHALSTPLLQVQAQRRTLGAGLYQVTACIRNTGALSTAVTQQALKMKRVKPIEVRLVLPEGGATLLSGQARQEVGHLDGWLDSSTRPATNEAWVDWLVKAAPGEVVEITAGTPRAGMVAVRITL